MLEYVDASSMHGWPPTVTSTESGAEASELEIRGKPAPERVSKVPPWLEPVPGVTLSMTGRV